MKLITFLLKYKKENLAALVISFLLLSFFLITKSGNNLYKSNSLTINYINDSLPHYVYKKIEDSINAIKFEENRLNNSENYSGSQIGILGLKTINDSRTDGNAKEKTYFTISSFNIKEGFQVVIKNGETLIKNDQGKTLSKTYLRYNNKKNNLFFPIKKKYVWIAKILDYFFLGVFFFLVIYVLISIPLDVIVNIALGVPFKNSNYKKLKLASKLVFAFLSFSLLIQLLVFLFNFKTITNHFTYNFINNFNFIRTTLLISLTFYLLSSAFKRGSTLQQENDLTI